MLDLERELHKLQNKLFIVNNLALLLSQNKKAI